jgi:hypothetical protein
MSDPIPAIETIQNPLIARMVGFIQSIGLTVRLATIPESTFLPGVTVQNGILIIDQERLLYPGDLLHEAGHLALLPATERLHADGEVGDDGGMEMGAIAWSYAAALHLGLTPATIFHDAGYRGGSQALLDNFTAGRYVGVPLLQWMGLTVDSRNAQARGIEPYPSMLRWLREE